MKEHRYNGTCGPQCGCEKRRITTDFLVQVALEYKSHIDYAPTASVARTFGVKHRQASYYVRKARKAGLLAPTTRGRALA